MVQKFVKSKGPHAFIIRQVRCIAQKNMRGTRAEHCLFGGMLVRGSIAYPIVRRNNSRCALSRPSRIARCVVHRLHTTGLTNNKGTL